MSTSHDERWKRAIASLEGLSVGDAFGQQFFHQEWRIGQRETTPPRWFWTDDTEMALSIVWCLRKFQGIDQDALALSFGLRYDAGRGYGPAMVFGLLPDLQAEVDWRVASRKLFDGSGSFGNGAAMRVAPVGAYFADDVNVAAEQGRLSAEVTHAHPEGIAGGMAVAVAAAIAAGEQPIASPRSFLEFILPHVPDSEVRRRMSIAVDELGPASTPDRVAGLPGNGEQVTAQDTVPFCLWMAGRNLDDYEAAMWETVAQGGDMDTNCAIVGGILAARNGKDCIPAAWRDAREALPRWHLHDH